MTTATAIPVFDATGTVLREITPRFSCGDVPVDLSLSNRGDVGPIITLLAPNVAYHIAAIVIPSILIPDRERLCIDGEGLNFGVKGAVYVQLSDVRQVVEAWRPGFWDVCVAQREAAA